jgi:hypothetical protein
MMQQWREGKRAECYSSSCSILYLARFLPFGTISDPQQEGKMQIWEYNAVHVRLDSSPDEITTSLNLRGEGGWELVQMVSSPASVNWIAILKRPKVM